MKIYTTFTNEIVAKRIEIITISTYSLLIQQLKVYPPLGEKDFEITYDVANGPIVYWPLEISKYKIGLNVEADYPLQIINQVAHELCHIFVDPRINGLFIEIICQKTSLDIIEILGLQYFGKEIVENYIEEIKQECRLKYNVDFSKIDLDWMRRTYRQKSLSNDILDREFNNIVAFELKKKTDDYGKFGIITKIKDSLSESFPKNSNDLEEVIPFAQVNFNKLAIKLGGNFGQTIKILLK